MTKQNSTKKMLLTSVLSLVMCITMLIGTTFAWFTDTAKSGVNSIQSGKLEIQLLDATGNSLEGKPLNFQKASGAESEAVLWEPGATYHTQGFQIKNAGNLYLKFEAVINGITDGNAKLLEAIDFYVATSVDATQAEGIDLTGEKVLAPGTYYDGSTEQGSANATTLYLIGHMKESAGNEYQNLTLEGLGITINATQYTSEYDSFDNQYDKDAIHYDILVTNTDEFYDAVANASGDTVIAIDGNIVMTKAVSNTGLNSIKFVSFDGNDTIDQATYNMHFAGVDVTFEGLTLTHGEKTYGNGGQTSTAFAVWDAKSVSYIDCTFNRSVGTIHADTHNFIGCTFNGVENPDNLKSEYPLYICDGKDYNVVDCVFNCTNRGAILFYNDGGDGVDTLNISNTKFFGDIIADKTAVEIHNNSNTQTYNVNIKDVTIGDGIINGLYRIKPANVGEVNVNVNGVTEVATASDKSELVNALGNAKEGDTIYLDTDVNVGSDQWALNKAVTIDLNGNELTTANNYGGMTMTNGASIKNGIINHTGNTAAIKIGDNKGGVIENVTINMTPTAGKTKTGIQVYNGRYVKEIKNVTITGATQGIEVAKGSRVDLIENVKVKAVPDGDKKGVALLVNAASVGKAVNCTFEGDYGVHMMLNGEFEVALELDNCTVIGSTAALIAHDEAGISNTTNCSLELTYDAETVFNGEFIWNFEEECQSVVTLNAPAN